ncbi:hypothetical protein Lw1_gp156 [Escherichia phage Lw1]|uniref:Uncharacterized protein n=2 Tax=Pseudotevenvirus TaxID=2842979 RepID=M9V2P2_9CAUD|nr:hypothetical protein RB16p150 [Escherichia phage RB16]YP_008060678.1 hypothetical protein Lw1_gp156 [Escherichia phage Lw1]ADJ55454.1 conserved hypothetical phage protein [Escherichia phage RB16]AGJ71563.1 hypothetical protein Lw1_gp156 [Escherichia phage Lw1]
MSLLNEILEMVEANKEAMKAKDGWVVVSDCFKPSLWTPVYINEAGNEERGFYEAAIFETAEQACDFWAYLSGEEPFSNYGVCRCCEL